MKPGYALRSEFNIGDRVKYKDTYNGTVIGIRVAYLDDPDNECRIRVAVRWDVKRGVDGWQSLIDDKFLRSMA